jgi:hypothetical protein
MKTNGVPAVREPDGLGALEAAIVNGDLANLTEEQRMSYYFMRCQAAGLDPRSKPFEYLILDKRMVLYATKGATDQLIANRKISVTIADRHYEDGPQCYEATCRAALPDGQHSDDIGVVFIGDLDGKALANAVMKAVTKAKRRAVLSVCGLGMLDESEVETIPGARIVPAQPVEAMPQAQLQPPAPAAEQPVRGECSAWIQWQIDEVENEWASICAKAKKPHVTLGEKGKRLNVWQVINGVVSDWLEDDPPLIEPDSVNTDGKRDRAKVLEIIRHQWSADDDGDGLMDDVRQYLREKLETAAKANGINLDAEPEEVTADA